jgi:hypothetical protein
LRATFTHAFTELWSGTIDDADRHMRDAQRNRAPGRRRAQSAVPGSPAKPARPDDIDTAEAFAEAAIAVARTNVAPHHEGASYANLARVA